MATILAKKLIGRVLMIMYTWESINLLGIQNTWIVIDYIDSGGIVVGHPSPCCLLLSSFVGHTLLG